MKTGTLFSALFSALFGSRDRSALLVIRYACLVMAWLSVVVIMFSRSHSLGSGWIYQDPSSGETNVGIVIAVRLYMAITSWLFFKAIAEVCGWMLVVEEHAKAIRDRLESRPADFGTTTTGSRAMPDPGTSSPGKSA